VEEKLKQKDLNDLNYQIEETNVLSAAVLGWNLKWMEYVEREKLYLSQE
jgi:hypothetical protein